MKTIVNCEINTTSSYDVSFKIVGNDFGNWCQNFIKHEFIE